MGLRVTQKNRQLESQNSLARSKRLVVHSPAIISLAARGDGRKSCILPYWEEYEYSQAESKYVVPHGHTTSENC
jgi:hypothetical protein